MSTSSSKKIVLWSSNGESFKVDEAVALQSQTIRHVVEDDCADNGIPLPNVTSKILSKLIKYCNLHSDSSVAAAAAADDLKLWDSEFVKVDPGTLFNLILGGFIDDFLSHFMCCCRALVQEWREVEMRGVYGPGKTKTSPPPSQYMES